AYATAKYRDGSRSGNKVKLAWSKQLALTNTGLRVSWSHQSEDFSASDKDDTVLPASMLPFSVVLLASTVAALSSLIAVGPV
ncbi:hypothetical protein MJH54_34940, partial [Salmonella enterica subsp. enterica serovar Montevideo]|nr:hypothetical protein [Salmonella enterica subsp. enterica serovar Montevideo]